MLSSKYKNISLVTDKRKVYVKKTFAKDIWEDVVANDLEQMKELCNAMTGLVYNVGAPKWLVHFSASLLYNLVYRWGGHYVKESDYLADKCSTLSPSFMAFLQRQYTLAHMGCSVVMTWDEQNERMLCMRSLDWKGADDIALATRIFSFVNEDDKEIAQIAGVTAMVGVLTGAKKGFSVAINYAPWKRSAKFKSDPTFLIRKLLEDEDISTYEKAKATVEMWEVGSPCFISLCGVKKGEACVIELGSDALHVREIGSENFIIQTNHYDLKSSPFTEHNEEPIQDEMSEQEWYDSELLHNSQRREGILRDRLSESSDEDMKTKLLSLYKEVPIMNYETAQWVLMNPKDGEIEVYASVDK